MCCSVTGPDAPECSRDAVLHAPAQNDSLLVAHLPDPGAYTITAAPRKNTLLEGVAALISLTILFGCAADCLLSAWSCLQVRCLLGLDWRDRHMWQEPRC